MADETESTLYIPGEKRAKRIVATIVNEEFRFPTIKAHKSKPKWEVTNPEDPDDTVSTKSVEVVILIARPNFFLSEEDKKAGKEAKEKRRLIVLRTDELIPEQLYVSPSSLRVWKSYCKTLLNSDDSFTTVLTKIHLEMHSFNGFTWPKPVFTKVRSLTEEEQDYINGLVNVVDERVGVYEEASDLDDAEAALVNRGKKPANDDDEDERDRASKKAGKSLKDDDDEEDEKPKTKKASKPKDEDDEEEEDKPKSTKKASKPKDEDDEEEDEKPKSKGSQKKVEDDEEDDDDLQSLKNKRASADKKPAAKPAKGKKDDEEDDD
jgi:hypothetical protein